MIGSVSYTSDNIIVCGNASGYFTKLEFATQSITAWSADTLSTTGGLPAVSFTSSLTAINEFPFTLPTIDISAAPEMGLLSMGTLTLQGDNESLSGIRLYSMLRDYDTDDEVMHVRFSYRTTATGDWIYRFWGTVNPQSIEVQCSDMNDPDTYSPIKFTVQNNVELLQRRDIRQFAEDKFKHQLNDYVANNKYITFIGTNPDGISAGKYLLMKWFFNNNSTNPIGWLPDTPTGDSQFVPFRWFKLVDVFKKASEYLGLELPVNNGESWSNAVTTTFGYNTANDGTTMTFVSIDKLYFQCGVYVLNGPSYVYANLFSFFDESKNAPYSFYNESNVFELLKKIATSLGLMLSVKIDSTGKRYLQVVESGYFDGSLNAVNTFTDTEENLSSDISFQPFFKKISGVVVCPSIDSEVVRGIDNNDSVSVDCIFHSANNLSVADGSYIDQSANTMTTREDLRLLGSLWASADGPAGSWDGTDGSARTINSMYTVCAIVPRNIGIASTLSGSDYDFKLPNQSTDLSYGAYQSTFGGVAINGVMYPALNGLVETYTELPQMAMAHYYFSPKNYDKDAVGIYRNKSRSLKIKASGIYPTIEIGQVLNIKVDNSYTDWFVTSIKENYTDFTTEYELESREA